MPNQTVTIAQALASNASSLQVLDTAANIAGALPNASLVARCASFTLSTAATIGTAAADKLASLGGKFHLGGEALAVQDTVANMTSASNAAGLALATTRQIEDAAFNLLNAPNSAFTNIAQVILTGTPTLTMAQLGKLESLPAFTVASGSHLLLQDSLTNYVPVLSAHINYFTSATSLSVRLDGSQIGAAGVAALATLAGEGKTVSFVAGASDTLLNVTATAQNLATDAASVNQIGGLVGLHITISNDGTAITAAVAAALTGITAFSAAAHTLYVSDTGAALTTLASAIFGHGFPQIVVTSGTLTATAAELLDPALHLNSGATVTLTGTATVTAQQAATLDALAGFAIANGASLTVADTIAHILQYASSLGIASAVTATDSETVTAANATVLALVAAAHPGHFSLGGHSLTVSDTAANLASLTNQTIALATGFTLSASGTVTAAQFTTLRDTLHVSLGGNTLTIDDTAANLLGLSGSLTLASACMLSGPATVTAAQLSTLSTLPSFSNGGFALTVNDTAANIALNEPAILHTATLAVVTDTGPINTSQADALALLSNAGKLAFQGGDQLVVSDSYANLIAGGNAAGVALANSLVVTDTAANLVTAAAHNWGTRSPTYALSANAVVTGPQATALAALGSSFTTNGHTLSVADTAANVLAASAALTSLNITATVNDAAATLGSDSSSLLALGAHLAAVHATDTVPLAAGIAAGLAPLAAKLTGTVTVGDSAAAIDTNLAGLAALGSHAAITATDSAANVGPHATDLATLGSALTVSLTDTVPVLASVAAALDPVAARLASGTALAVSDSAAAIAGAWIGLSVLGTALGTLTITGSHIVSAAQAAELLPLQSHLGLGVQLAVNDTASAIATNQAALTSLRSDGRLASVSDTGDTAAAVAAAVTALNAVGATVTISDIESNILGAISTLAQVTGLTGVTITDVSTPIFTLTVSAYATDKPVLNLVTNTHTIAISDSAANIENDLASSSSVLAGITTPMTITPLGGAPLVLSQAVALKPGVITILPDLIGTLQVTGVDVAHLNAVAALSPASITVADSATNIQADLSSGSSALLADRAAISAITVLGGGTITLTAAQALTAHVDDSASSLFGLLSGATLSVVQAGTAQVASLLALHTPPAAISVSDTAANITAALTNPGSAILTSPAAIVALHVSDGNPVVLTEAQDMATGVNDGPHAALTKLSGAPLDVTGVAVNQLAAVEGTAAAPSAVFISDTGADISGAVPALLADLSNLGAITISSGTVSLTAAQALMPNVASGLGSLVSLLPGHAYTVTGATIAQMPALTALAIPPGSYALTDTSANLVADLTATTSQWATHASSVTVQGGTLSLTAAQAAAIAFANRTSDLGALTSGTTVDITGVPVSELSQFGGFAASLAGGVTLHLEVTDTALNLATDLALTHPSQTLEAAYINSTTLNGAGGTLTAAQLTAVAGISGLNANGITIPVQDGAVAIATLSSPARALAGSVTVSDTASNVSGELAALQSTYHGALTINLTGVSPSLTVTAAAYTANQPTIEAIANTGCVVVTGTAAQIAAIEPSLAADAHVAAVQITDTGFNVVSNLAAIAALGAEATVTLSDVGSISASVASALVAAGLPHVAYGSLVVGDTGTQIAALAESGTAGAAFLAAHGAELTSTSNVALLDAQALSALGSALNLNGQTVNIWDTASHLTQPGAAAALASLVSSHLVTGIYLKTTGGTVTLTAANTAALLAIPGLSIDNPPSAGGAANLITVADTAQNLASNYTSLHADASDIAAFVVTASATVSGQTLGELQTLGATTAGGVALTMSDTASNILAAASVIGASVQAASYTLDANASISSAQALALAALPNFSAGAYTLTAALGADTAVTVAQANNLASLGSALVVTGHEFTISGSAAALTGLTTAGAAVAHVTLTDTLANISALPSNSPLLSGLISVSDAEGLTAAQAGSFLSLLTSAGVPSGNISFGGNTETVTDSIANLRALTSSAAWTGNSTLQSHFALVAEDTVANLTNPANAGFLSTLSGQELAATSTVTAATAASLAALPAFNLGGHSLMVSDTATNLVAPANAAGLALATSVTLSAPATLNTAGAETLLQLSSFHLTQPLSIIDTAANLLDGTLAGLIAGHSQVQVSLSGPQTLDAQTAASLVALQGFSDTTDMHIVDSSAYLLAPAASAAEAMAASVSLAGNEFVSANTVLRLSEIPHFTDTGGTLTLASNDFANAATLQAIADLGTNFSEGGHSLTLMQNDLTLTPTELAAINADGILSNGYLISAVLMNSGATDTSNLLSVTATGVAGAAVNIYGATGSLISTTHETNASFTVTAPDVGSGSGNNFSITETVGGVESAPVVVLDQAALENAVALASASFASSGQIEVDSGKYINLYTAGASLPNAPALVYNPVAHTISLDIPNAAPVTLITLGASTTPASLETSEILIKHHG